MYDFNKLSSQNLNPHINDTYLIQKDVRKQLDELSTKSKMSKPDIPSRNNKISSHTSAKDHLNPQNILSKGIHHHKPKTISIAPSYAKFNDQNTNNTSISKNSLIKAITIAKPNINNDTASSINRREHSLGENVKEFLSNYSQSSFVKPNENIRQSSSWILLSDPMYSTAADNKQK